MRGFVGGRRRSAVLIGAVALVAVAGCTSGTGATGTGTATTPSHDTTPTAPTSSSTPTAPPVQLTNSTGGKAITPTKPVTIGVVDGKLTAVTMVNPAGRKVAGALAADGSSWHTTEVLGYGKTYQVTAVATNKLGATVTKRTTVTTLTPNNMTMPYIDDVYGASIADGGTYGVAMVVNLVFDEQIPDRAAAERALQVTTTPHIDGAWYWVDNSHVHWRPKTYYQPGTKVTVTAKVYGKDLGDGLYGQADQSVSFTIGRRQLTVADDNAPHGVDKVRVYNGAGQVIRTMNTSMGKHYGTTVNGNYINFYTLDGTYTVLGHENPARMCSDSYGLPVADGGYPCENIPYGTKISTDGIYLHELDTTVWAQNSGVDVSHGCLNLNYDNAKWFYEHSMVGDPVVVHGAKGAPTLQIWQGGDWTLSWSQWRQGSAL
jgi:lipoprotein-anchoring transpeptidase ErfK/SrfK